MPTREVFEHYDRSNNEWSDKLYPNEDIQAALRVLGRSDATPTQQAVVELPSGARWRVKHVAEPVEVYQYSNESTKEWKDGAEGWFTSEFDKVKPLLDADPEFAIAVFPRDKKRPDFYNAYRKIVRD